MTEKNIISELFNFGESTNESDQSKKYQSLGLDFNPFPRSGTTNINGSDIYNQNLIPVNGTVKKQVIDFIQQSLAINQVDPSDKFISATITGNYGSGKTQLLMFVKYLLGEIAAVHKSQKVPYVIYVDNPGVKLLEFIGSIISKIGEDNFKKFIWTKVINLIKNNDEFKNQLKRFESKRTVLFEYENPDPFAEQNSVSYKRFLDAYVKNITTTKVRREFDEAFRKVLLSVLEKELTSSILAQYFYELISEDYGINKTWEALSNGSIKQLDKREAEIINYIVRLIKEQGYTDFFILVDEFEDITEGRLTKTQVDNYVYNLRTLLDDHREWCLLFAMTGQALKKLRSVSPPLADRIAIRLINLQDLNTEEARYIIYNYIAIAQKKNEVIVPFDDNSIKKLNELVEGNARRLLRSCYYLIEKAAEQKIVRINEEFINTHYAKDTI